MDKSLIIQSLLETFLTEFDERLHAMSRDLLALESSDLGDAERNKRLQDLLRNAHSLKGAARAVDVKLIEEACHRLEDILSAVRSHPNLLDPHLIQLFFGVLDGLAEAGKLLRKQESLDESLLFGVSLEMEMFIETTIAPLGPIDKNKTAVPGVREPAKQTMPAAPGKGIPADNPDGAEGGDTSLGEITSVRVDTEKLDVLLLRSGELLTARQQLRSVGEQLNTISESIASLSERWQKRAKSAAAKRNVQTDSLSEQTPESLNKLTAQLDTLRNVFRQKMRQLEQSGSALDQQVSRIRMLPFSHACAGFDRMVRDLARSGGKDVEFRVEGGDVELDRSVLESLRDPLRHLVRNAVDHGIEKPEDRKRQKKSPRGTVVAAAMLRGGQVSIAISDDGRGLQAESIRKRAAKLGLATPDTEQKLIEAIFLPGFSTASDSVSMVSGRGIGLDVVRNQVKALHGEVEVSFTEGQRAQFRLTVPLTLTLLRVLLVRSAGQLFGVANHYVHKLLRLRHSDVVWVGERPMIVVEGKPVGLTSLAHALSFPQEPISDWPGKREVVVLRSESRMSAFLVDELVAEQEVMVKTLGNRVKRIRNIAGALILHDGTIALTIHVADLLWGSQPLVTGTGKPLLSRTISAPQERRQRKILVVDDSVTTRSLERSILEAAGYAVELAQDGVQGWERVQQGGIDLVLSDIDMPLLNGLQLTQTIRKTERFRELPVILITSNDDQLSRDRGLKAGATAYMTKGNFDQNVLLNLIEQLT